MSYLLPHLHSGWAVDQAILAEEERLVVIRFGHDWDETCMQCTLSSSFSRSGPDWTRLPKMLRSGIDLTRLPEMFRSSTDWTRLLKRVNSSTGGLAWPSG
ncbi:hypothetical protein B296_00010052 [Ensete ventricosum]|uniref:Thioredoxin-like fold domain-containing protein n=1 Tax=Ensete ventricosum TaxID=4639 RepID=A0A426ZUI1_ENSVE|nr:hypothetical protein B296_00010052 [Ensete ventricosum]